MKEGSFVSMYMICVCNKNDHISTMTQNINLTKRALKMLLTVFSMENRGTAGIQSSTSEKKALSDIQAPFVSEEF